MAISVQQRALERDGHECQECGVGVGFQNDDAVADAQVHHIVPKSEGGGDGLDNLVTLCRGCHDGKHPNGVGRPAGNNGDYKSKTRALLTELEREQIAGQHGDDRRYQAASRARSRIRDELAEDVSVLEDHHPDLLEELRAVVCGTNEAEQ